MIQPSFSLLTTSLTVSHSPYSFHTCFNSWGGIHAQLLAYLYKYSKHLYLILLYLIVLYLIALYLITLYMLVTLYLLNLNTRFVFACIHNTLGFQRGIDSTSMGQHPHPCPRFETLVDTYYLGWWFPAYGSKMTRP